eukprot:TRINITY_DN6361_c0_g1_i1.p1 TRINITY_DN6361_c0_g1~~TRINITY_DN6361_c0_g1_i1.p1  ORF type:complete len:201 (-),score=25.87 TRINITY_DN6361_c0_g1_i1:42-596(-)
MGNIKSIFKKLGRTDQRILMLGIDNAGKTTCLYSMLMGEVVTTVPTIGFNVETVSYKKLNFTMWDVGGQNRIRKLWRHYFEGTTALIFVVDSNDRERIEEARAELEKLLVEDELKDAVLLVLANKQDLPNAVSVSELSEALGLFNLRERIWNVQSTSAIHGSGLVDGLEWLSTAIKRRKKNRDF